MHHLAHGHQLGALVAVGVSIFTAVAGGMWAVFFGSRLPEPEAQTPSSGSTRFPSRL